MSIKSDVLSRVSSGTTGHGVLATDAMKGSLVKLEYQRIEQANIGDMVLHDVEAMPETREAVPEEIDGLVDLGLLGRRTVLTDYLGEIVARYSPEYEPVDIGSWHKVKVRATLAKASSWRFRLVGGSTRYCWIPGRGTRTMEAPSFSKQHQLVELDQTVELFIDTMSIWRYNLECLSLQCLCHLTGCWVWAFLARYKVLLKLDDNWCTTSKREPSCRWRGGRKNAFIRRPRRRLPVGRHFCGTARLSVGRSGLACLR